ncbi:MAG: DEAD/DEAH box helicase [Candidatus Helarchaeota archaeon]
MSFSEVFNHIQIRIPYDVFKEKVAKFISKLTFNNQDKHLLDKISLNQILNASYVYGGNPKSSIYSNFLCPYDLYELLNYTTWRINSSESIISLIKIPLNQKEINLKIDLQFFTANILKRISKKYPDYPKDKEIPEDNNNELIEKSKIKLEETEDIIYKVNKICLGPLNYIHKKINFQLNLENNHHEYNFSYNKKIPLAIKKNDEGLLYEFSVDALKRKYQIKIYRENIEFKINLSLKLLDNKDLENTDDCKYFLFEFKFKNLNRYYIRRKPNNKGKTLARDKILRNSIICPLIKIDLLNADLCRYNQQLKEIYEIIRTGDKNKIEEIFNNNLKKLKFFKQFNCVQTFSLKKPNQILITPFGIFDNPREFPIVGPPIENLLSFRDIKNNLTELSNEEKKFLEENQSPIFKRSFSELLVLLFKSLKLYFEKLGINKPKLWKFQWDNTQWRLRYLIRKFKAIKINQDYQQQSRIIKAPTGSGKTLIFFIDSILHYMFTGERVAIIFPTRILNIEMFQNLALLIYCLRENSLLYDCGLFIGTKTFNLTQLDLSDTIGNTFGLIPMCPKCLTINSVKIEQRDFRKIGVCSQCNHEISYIYMPKEVPDYLPIINIATPDKLFYEALNAKYAYLSLRSFGAPVIKCPRCGRYNSYLKAEVQKAINNRDMFNCTLRFPDCENKINPNKINIENRPIGFIILDEIHSIYGFTGIILSIFFRFLKIIQRILLKNNNYCIDFEAGTATIANEKEFFNALTTQDISSFPIENEYFTRYFNYNLEKIRYRIIIQSVILTSVRNAFSRAIINDYVYNNLESEIKNELNKMNYNPDAYHLLLGYLYRKSDGYTTSNSIHIFVKDNPKIDRDLKPPIFISGDSSSNEVSQFLNYVNSNKIRCFLANLIISLGMNIKNLNNMILFAAPRSINEQIQTIGRLGRKDVPGHACILLMPNRPRDEFLYENFHHVLVDIKGYLEIKPIQSTNLFISRMIIHNLIYSLMNGFLRFNYKYGFRNQWSRLFLNSDREIHYIYTCLKKILYVNSYQYQSLEENLDKIIKKELLTVFNEIVRMTHIKWVGEYFRSKNRLLGGIRGSKNQIGIRILEENLKFIENKTKMRFDTSIEDENINEIGI